MNIHQKIIFCFLLFFIFGNYYTYASTTNQITEINNGDNSDIIIQSEKNSSFSIGLPVCCTLDPSTGRGEYQISVKGDIDVHNQLKIELVDKYTEENGDTTSNYNFFLTNKTANNNKKEDILVTINMDKSLFDYNELSYDTSSVIHVSLESEKLSAGTWEGIIEYNISLIEKNIPDTADFSTPGLYDKNNVLLCSWEESGILLEELQEPPDDFFADCPEEEYLSRMKQYLLSIQTSACHVLNEDYPETRKVLMPDSIIELPAISFVFCDNITDLYLSNGLTFYNDESIMYCKNLTNLVMGDNIIDSDINFNSFDNYGLPNLKRLVLPKMLPGIPGGLQNCASLKELVLPQNITEIHYAAFEDCTSLEEIVLPDSITNIDSNAFRNCRSLRKINIPNSVTNIGDYAFYGCSSLEEIVLPDSITSIDDYTFYGCRNLKKVILSENLTSIGYAAFKDCTSLEDIVLPSNLTSIGFGAFNYCSSISNIIIPNSITNISGYAFRGCLNLESITIPNGVTTIGEGAFQDCASLSNVLIPNSVTNIEAYAFASCYNLKEITLSDVLTKINQYSFANCFNLKNLIIPDSVTTIEASAFQYVPHVEYHGTAVDDGSHWGAESIN